MKNVWKLSWCLGILAALACTACGDDETALQTYDLGEASASPAPPANAALIRVPDEVESQLLRQSARRETAATGDAIIEVAEAVRKQLPHLCSDPSSSLRVIKVDKNFEADCEVGQAWEPCTLPPSRPKPPASGEMYLARCVTPELD